MGNDPSDEDTGNTQVNVDLSDSSDAPTDKQEGNFEHPDDVPTSDMDDVPEVNSADDAVDGDNERKERLRNKAKEMSEQNTPDNGEDNGTPVDLGGPTEDPTAADGGAAETQAAADTGSVTETPDSDSVEQAGDSIFTDDEAEEIEEEYSDDFELETLDDIPDDFDYEDQDTSHYGAEEEANIKHNGVVFELKQPDGAKEDKFWSEIQNKTNLAAMFDTLIKYGVSRPRDIEERMEEENWTGFAKAGLAMKVSSFLGLDALQDF